MTTYLNDRRPRGEYSERRINYGVDLSQRLRFLYGLPIDRMIANSGDVQAWNELGEIGLRKRLKGA